MAASVPGGHYAAFEQLLRVPARGDVAGVRAEHPHELADDLAFGELRGPSCAPGRPRVLLDREVPGAERGDLRQVRDADDLAALGQLAQPLADRSRRLAADAGVDLVETSVASRRRWRRRAARA